MESRMNKYYETETEVPSRQLKNSNLYREINTTEIEDFNVNSNIAVLDDDGRSIDIQKIREMLDKKYREAPKNKKIADYDSEEYPSISLDETREYDINAILEKAKEGKEVDYEVERLKKIRNTQYDILNSLDLDAGSTARDEELKEDQARLMELINTITSKEALQSTSSGDSVDPLDLFTDLKGTENTMVVPGLKEAVLDDVKEEIRAEVKKEVKREVKQETENSFITNSLAFTESDFDDFNDLKEDVKSNSVLIKFLTVVVILVLIFGIVFMLNGIFDWGLFF